jgi:hypothetical protein
MQNEMEQFEIYLFFDFVGGGGGILNLNWGHCVFI